MGDEDVSDGVKDARRRSTMRMMGDEDVVSDGVKNARRRSTDIRMMADEDVLSTGVKGARASRVSGIKQREGDDGQRLSASLDDVSGVVKDARRPSTNIRMMGDEDVSDGVKDARRRSTIRMMGDEDVVSEDVMDADSHSTDIRMMGDEDVLSEGAKDARASRVRGMMQHGVDDGQRLSTSLDDDALDSTLVLPMQPNGKSASENTAPQKAPPQNARPFPQDLEEEIRNKLLEEEWNKRPTEVRSELLTALHSKPRNRANGEK